MAGATLHWMLIAGALLHWPAFMEASSSWGKISPLNDPITAGKELAMGLNLPCVLGPFSVDADGRLFPTEADRPAGFGFRWRGRAMHAQLGVAGDAGALAMQATLGRVPSTASPDQAGLRPHSFATVRELQGGLPRPLRVQLLADHRVILRTQATVALPITAEALLVEITRFLLGLSPYLDLLDEIGAVPGFAEPVVTGGNVSIWPG